MPQTTFAAANFRRCDRNGLAEAGTHNLRRGGHLSHDVIFARPLNPYTPRARKPPAG